jgi:hypothetical protein
MVTTAEANPVISKAIADLEAAVPSILLAFVQAAAVTPKA